MMKCIVKGCHNHRGGGGKLLICGRCYVMLETGVVEEGHTFIHDLKDELRVAATLVERAHDVICTKDDA